MQNESNTTIFEGIGLQLQESADKLILNRSKSGNRIDTTTLILGILSIPILAYSIGLLIYEIEIHSLSTGISFSIILLFLLGVYLFSFFLAGMSRKLMFSGFSLEKNQSEYKVSQRINFKLTEKTYSHNSQIILSKNSKDLSLLITDNSNEYELFELKELSNEQLERVENIVAKFNN